MSEHFTLSIEYELVADFDIDDEPYIETKKEQDRAFKFVKDQILLDMSRGKIGRRFDDKYKLSKKKLDENEERMFRENDTKKMGKRELKKLHQKYVTWTWVNFFIDWLLTKVDPDDEDVTDRKINRPWETDVDDYIATLMLKSLQLFVYGQNMGFLIDKFKEYMPNFYKKYN